MNERETVQCPEILAPCSEVSSKHCHSHSASSPAASDLGDRFAAERSTLIGLLVLLAKDEAVYLVQEIQESCGNPMLMVNGSDCCLWIKNIKQCYLFWYYNKLPAESQQYLIWKSTFEETVKFSFSVYRVVIAKQSYPSGLEVNLDFLGFFRFSYEDFLLFQVWLFNKKCSKSEDHRCRAQGYNHLL